MSKITEGKIRLELVPVEAIVEIGKALTHGAKIYGDNNWKNVDKDLFYAALMRHIIEWRTGNLVDKDSGLNPLAHVLANAAFLLWMDINRAAPSGDCGDIQ